MMKAESPIKWEPDDNVVAEMFGRTEVASPLRDRGREQRVDNDIATLQRMQDWTNQNLERMGQLLAPKQMVEDYLKQEVGRLRRAVYWLCGALLATDVIILLIATYWR